VCTHAERPDTPLQPADAAQLLVALMRSEISNPVCDWLADGVLDPTVLVRALAELAPDNVVLEPLVLLAWCELRDGTRPQRTRLWPGCGRSIRAICELEVSATPVGSPVYRQTHRERTQRLGVPASEGPPVNTSYEYLLAHVLEHGTDKTDRTGTGTRSISLPTHMAAQQVGLQVGELIWTGGDCHIYDNHVAQSPSS